MLSYFIRHKLQTDELWRRLRVVLSSAEAPGEGEHKIAEHIRSARELPRRHCVYGLDADVVVRSWLGPSLVSDPLLRQASTPT